MLNSKLHQVRFQASQASQLLLSLERYQLARPHQVLQADLQRLQRPNLQGHRRDQLLHLNLREVQRLPPNLPEGQQLQELQDLLPTRQHQGLLHLSLLHQVCLHRDQRRHRDQNLHLPGQEMTLTLQGFRQDLEEQIQEHCMACLLPDQILGQSQDLEFQDQEVDQVHLEDLVSLAKCYQALVHQAIPYWEEGYRLQELLVVVAEEVAIDAQVGVVEVQVV